MAEPWVNVGLFRYSALPNEGWDRAKWDEGHWDGGLAAGGNWYDITCDVRGIDIQRGKRNVVIDGGVETGVMTLDLDNRDGKWSKFVDISIAQDGSLYTPALTAGVIVRVSSSDGTNTNVHFTGPIERWTQDWTRVDNVVHVTCSDGWRDFVQQPTVAWPPGSMGESVPARMRRLVERAGWNITGPISDVPPVYLQNGSVSLIGSLMVGFLETGLTTNSTVADEVLKTALSDGGKAFLDGDGAFVYLNRNWVTPGYLVPSIPSTVVGYPDRLSQDSIPLFGDHCGPDDHSAELPYTDLEWDYDGTNVVGTIIVANANPPSVRNTTGDEFPEAWHPYGQTITSSQGRPVITLGDLRYTTQAEADTLAQYYMTNYSDAYIAAHRLEVFPALDTRLWDVAPALRIGDHIRILRREPQNTLDMEAVIEGIGLKITPEPGREVAGHHFGKWTYDYITSAATTLISDQGVTMMRQLVTMGDARDN